METPATYTPTTRFDETNELYTNHFRFQIEALPDLSFYLTTVQLPTITSAAVQRATPFTHIKEVGDHLTYGSMNVTFKVDAKFRTYASLYWWMKGYGFPHSYDEVNEFREARARMMANPRPSVREIEKTNAVLTVLQPDTESALAEFRFTDIFPVSIGEITFSTQNGADEMRTTAAFEYTEFDLYFA